MKRETLGKIATDLLAKDEPHHNVVDMQREMQKNYEENFYECLHRGKKEHSGDFFVVVQTKAERLLKNVIRNMFFHRKSCPTPTYDNAVYKYCAADDLVDFLWVLPSKKACEMLRENALEVAADEKDLLHFVLDFYDGTLDVRARKLNGEDLDIVLL